MKLSDTDRLLLRDAVRAVESKSRAEIVLSVRPRSGAYSRGPLLFGALVGWLFLGFQLFSSTYEFSLAAIFLEPVMLGVAMTALASSLPDFTRILTSPKKRGESVERAARATFLERGVGLTRERTGVLIYVSLLEREARVIADKGVTDTVPPEIWRAAARRVERLCREARNAGSLAFAIQEFGEPLGAEMPARADDTNELPDGMDGAQ